MAFLQACSTAITLDEQTIIYTEKNPPQWMIVHEQYHQEQIAQIGGATIFWKKYLNDPAWACEMEKQANEAAGIYPIDNHPVCLIESD